MIGSPRDRRPRGELAITGWVALCALTLIASGCTGHSLSSEAHSETSVEVHAPKSWPAAARFNFPDTLRLRSEPRVAWVPLVRFSAGRYARTLTAQDLGYWYYGSPHTPWYRLGDDADSLRIAVLTTRVGQEADTARAELALPLERDRAWDILVEVYDHDPSRRWCINCYASAFSLSGLEGTGAADSLWIIWTPIQISRQSGYIP